MAELSLADAKLHLRVSFNDDDAYIDSLIEAAWSHVLATGTSISSPPESDVLHAVRLLISHWYEHREAAATEPPRAIAFGVNALLQPHREQSI